MPGLTLYKRTIKRIDGMPIGSAVQICGETTIPSGWVVISDDGKCETIGGTIFFARTIKRVS